MITKKKNLRTQYMHLFDTEDICTITQIVGTNQTSGTPIYEVQLFDSSLQFIGVYRIQRVSTVHSDYRDIAQLAIDKYKKEK